MKVVKLILFGALVSSFSTFASTSAIGVYEDLSHSGLTDEEILQLEVDASLEAEAFLENTTATTEDTEESKMLDDNRRRRFICVSRNIRGNRFTGEARNRYRARRRALRKCRRKSRFFIAPTCQIRRCRKVRRGFGRI